MKRGALVCIPFGDVLSLTISDPSHSRPGEDRFVTIGSSYVGRVLVVVHCDVEERIRSGVYSDHQCSKGYATRKEGL